MNHQGAKNHLSRLPDEMPVLVDDPPVSGRSQPRPAPLPDGFAHEVRFEPLPGDSGYAYLRAVCEPCAWSVALDGGHSLADLQRLVVMHEGPSPLVRSCTSVTGSTQCQLPAGHYHHHHAMVGCHSITWPKDDEPFGTESEPGA